jgi:hypothetical protein
LTGDLSKKQPAFAGCILCVDGLVDWLANEK